MSEENFDYKVSKKTITYSKSAIIPLTKLCRNKCGYCSYRSDIAELTVPYQTIKQCKDARHKHECREALFTAGERPDRYSSLRNTLDIWGFATYIDYVNTVCELAFLEGLMPSIDIGVITYEELKKIRRIISALRLMLESTDKNLVNKIAHRDSPKKTPDKRIEVLKFAGELKVPVTTGILIGIGESKSSRKESLGVIRDIHNEFGHIQNVIIQDFVPGPGTPMQNMQPPSHEEMLSVVEMAREILPEDIVITIHPKAKEDIMSYIKAGVTDLGSLSQTYWDQIDSIQKELSEHGYTLHKRLPIFERFIMNKWYSRKLGQVMDRYRVMLKQDLDRRHLEQADSELILA